MTLVFKIPNGGSLQQLQIGPADILATISSAYSTWGWMDGLVGIGEMFRILKIGSTQLEQKKLERLFEALEPETGACRILTQHGVEVIPLGDSPKFGKTESCKVVGMTLCALAYNIPSESAIHYFMEYFVPALFADSLATWPGSEETIYKFLIDKRQTILNEGAIHGLDERFEHALKSFPLVDLQKASSHPKLKASAVTPDEWLIPAFFLWLRRNIDETYYTRSAAVARVAICLKVVGFKIQEIIAWNGEGKQPRPIRSLVLVTGGASETDSLLGDEEIKGYLRTRSTAVLHYRFDTVGAMLWSAFQQEADHPHEVFQQDFEEIDRAISQDLRIQWAYLDPRGGLGQIQAVPVWRAGRGQASRMAVRLATIYFPESVDDIAMYYERLAKEKYLEAAKCHAKSNVLRTENKDLQRFFTVTSSICLALVSCLAGGEFRRLKHSIMLDLSSGRELSWLCRELDAVMSVTSNYSRAITIIASVHCGIGIPDNSFHEAFYSKEEVDNIDQYSLVGWRVGAQAVLPRLLYSMQKPLDRDILGFRCVDEFIANIPTHTDGSVTCPWRLPLDVEVFTSTLVEEAMQARDLEHQALTPEGIPLITFGRPMPRKPNKPLYLSIERPPSMFSGPQLSLCGRIDGKAVGYVGVQQVLATLALSWSDENGHPIQPCPPGQAHNPSSVSSNQQPANEVFNVPATAYSGRNGQKPLCKFDQEPRYHSYVQVFGDSAWAIYLAGQGFCLHRVVFGCADCAAHSGANCNSPLFGGLRMLIGLSRPLAQAADGGDEEAVRLLLEQDGANLNMKCTTGRTPFSWNARNGHDAIVQLLLERDGIDLESKCLYGRTPLSWAAGHEHNTTTQPQPVKKADLNSKFNDGRTPLSWAAEKVHDAVVGLPLEQHGVQVDSKDTESATIPLLRAADQGHEVVVQLLLGSGADIESKNKWFATPLRHGLL